MDRYVPLPPLPPRISRLNELACDLWWSWNAPARAVFRDLDLPLWRFTDHNPVLLLHLVEPERLEHAAADPEFLRLYDAALATLDEARAGAGTWWSSRPAARGPIARVSPEFSLHQSLPLDTAGLGVAVGDACKEASDLGLPIVGVGLMYPRSYAHQRVSGEGWQQEVYEHLDWSDTPVSPAMTADRRRCAFSIRFATGDVRVEVWQVRAGRVTIYLLDTDVAGNEPWDRALSSVVVRDDPEALVRQAILLGAGSVRALDCLGIEPWAWHVHEGAAGCVAFERLARAIEEGASWHEALARIRQTSIYDTRQPAPLRAEDVPFTAIDRHLAACWPALAPLRERVLTLGAIDTDRGGCFNAGVFGARAASAINAPQPPPPLPDAWSGVGGPDTVRHAIPPGVHLPTWISREIGALFERHLGADWLDHQDDAAWWDPVRDMPDDDLWLARQRLRGFLVNFARERARRRWAREEASAARLVALGTLLDPATLTIGFARRLTDDARPDLVFHDAARLARILTTPRRPVQILFAGKAHPGDEAGKHRLQSVFRHALDPRFGGRVAFLEDYDLHAARLLVQGCDVWLSTPRREALPSLGALKAAVNGVPHLATPAGWLADTWMEDNGWVADGGAASDPAAQDAADARSLYRLLEEQIVPAFYERDRRGVPSGWLQIVKATLLVGVPRAGARHAVKATAARLYAPAAAGPRERV